MSVEAVPVETDRTDDLAATLRANDRRYAAVAENVARGQSVIAAPVEPS